jgi:hypothetical protein
MAKAKVGKKEREQKKFINKKILKNPVRQKRRLQSKYSDEPLIRAQVKHHH